MTAIFFFFFYFGEGIQIFLSNNRSKRRQANFRWKRKGKSIGLSDASSGVLTGGSLTSCQVNVVDECADSRMSFTAGLPGFLGL